MAAYDLNYYELMKKAEEGDLDAMFGVASYIIWGDPTSTVEPEMGERALKYYEANADAGDGDSMLDLGAMYLEGRGVPKDEKKAMEWYRKGAGAGAYRACRCLGNYYKYDTLDDGTPVPTADEGRLQKAFEWFQRGAEEQHEENCLYELGDFYSYGICIPKDEKKAFELYQEAYSVIMNVIAKDDMSLNDCYSDVCLRLAECWHYGIGTKKDLSAARKMIQIARDECKRRKDAGDMYGGAYLPRAEKEWLLIMQETGF